MALRRRLRLLPAAVLDLEGIREYSAKRWGEVQASLYLDLVLAALDGLADGSRIGVRSDVRPHLLRANVRSHTIFYRQSDTSVDIVRVLHQSMDVRRRL